MEFVKIKDICTFLPKSKIKAGEGLENGKYIFFTSSDIKSQMINEYLFDEEAIILGTGGKPSCNYYNGKFSVSTDNFVLKSTSINIKYLYYYLRHNKLSILEKGFHGASLKHISKDYIKDILIPLYDKEKQNEIVNNLDYINSIIEKCTSQLAYLETIVKSQFIEMFGDPINNDKNWETDQWQNVIAINKYKGNVDLDNNKVWLLNLDMIESNSGKILNYLYEEKEEIPSSTIKFDNKCVLYSKLRPYLNKVVIPNKSGYATSELISMNPNSLINKYFLANLLRCESFVTFANETSYGAKMPRASVDEIKKFSLILPPIELQNKFASFVQKIDKSKYFGGVNYGLC